MAKSAIVYEDQPDGGRFMDGPHLIARLISRTQGEIPGVSGKVVVWKDMPAAEWTLHWASSHVSAAAVLAVVAALPAEAKSEAKPSK